jgi:23S rRNA (uracil1939-C5)-methyltransferase
MVSIGDIVELHITRIAGLGDGVATHDGLPVFVPHVCANERVRAEVVQTGKSAIHARLHAVVSPSPDRQPPPCPHFGTCGGCELQQLTPAAYAAFKQSIAAQVAAQLGCERVQTLFQSGPASRRRAEAKISVEEGAVTVGFNAQRSHAVVDVPECKVVEPAILSAMNTWRELLQSMKKPSRFRSIQFTAAENGLDVQVSAEGKLKPADAEALRVFAQGMARFTLNGESIKSGEPSLSMGGASVELPIGSFLQATAASEARMVELVLQGCQGHATVADLYCGIGTFSLPLAQAGHRVLAYEGGQEAVTALFNAARRADLPVSAYQRDLFAQPLTEELSQAEAVVINPPRNGALPQCEAIAASAVRKVVMVSCNPATFTRDAQALQVGGFALQTLAPIDQFTWSHHLELVGVFTR